MGQSMANIQALERLKKTHRSSRVKKKTAKKLVEDFELVGRNASELEPISSAMSVEYHHFLVNRTHKRIEDFYKSHPSNQQSLLSLLHELDTADREMPSSPTGKSQGHQRSSNPEKSTSEEVSAFAGESEESTQSTSSGKPLSTTKSSWTQKFGEDLRTLPVITSNEPSDPQDSQEESSVSGKSGENKAMSTGAEPIGKAENSENYYPMSSATADLDSTGPDNSSYSEEVSRPSQSLRPSGKGVDPGGTLRPEYPLPSLSSLAADIPAARKKTTSAGSTPAKPTYLQPPVTGSPRKRLKTQAQNSPSLEDVEPRVYIHISVSDASNSSPSISTASSHSFVIVPTSAAVTPARDSSSEPSISISVSASESEASPSKSGIFKMGPAKAGTSSAGLSKAGSPSTRMSKAGTFSAGMLKAGISSAGLSKAGTSSTRMLKAGTSSAGMSKAEISSVGLWEAGSSSEGSSEEASKAPFLPTFWPRPPPFPFLAVGRSAQTKTQLIIVLAFAVFGLLLCQIYLKRIQAVWRDPYKLNFPCKAGNDDLYDEFRMCNEFGEFAPYD